MMRKNCRECTAKAIKSIIKMLLNPSHPIQEFQTLSTSKQLMLMMIIFRDWIIHEQLQTPMSQRSSRKLLSRSVLLSSKKNFKNQDQLSNEQKQLVSHQRNSSLGNDLIHIVTNSPQPIPTSQQPIPNKYFQYLSNLETIKQKSAKIQQKNLRSPNDKQRALMLSTMPNFKDEQMSPQAASKKNQQSLLPSLQRNKMLQNINKHSKSPQNIKVQDEMMRTFGQPVTRKTKKIKDQFYFNPEDNFNIVTNTYYDYNDLQQYKNPNAVRLQKDIEVKLQKQKKSSQPLLNRNSPEPGRLQDTKNRHITDYIQKLYGEGISQDQVLLMRKFFYAEIDNRMLQNLKLGFIKLDSSKKGKKNSLSSILIGVMQKESFKNNLLRPFLRNMTPQIEELALKLFSLQTQPNEIELKKISRFIDLFNFYPVAFKQDCSQTEYRNRKDRNLSSGVYFALSSNIAGSHSFNWDQIRHFKEEQSDLAQLLEYFWLKVEQKFQKMSQIFRFFDADNDGVVSFEEFRTGLDVLNLKLHEENIQKVFDYIDKNKNGFIDYNEFCQLMEQRRRNIDPYNPNEKVNDSFRKKIVKPKHKESHKRSSSIIGNSSIGNSETSENYSKYPSPYRTSSFKNSNFEFGKATQVSDNIKQVINGQYNREWIQRQQKRNLARLQGKRKLGIESADSNISSSNISTFKNHNKIFRNFHTKASVKRTEAQLKKIKEAENSDDEWKLRKFRQIPASQGVRRQFASNLKYKQERKALQKQRLYHNGSAIIQSQVRNDISPINNSMLQKYPESSDVIKVEDSVSQIGNSRINKKSMHLPSLRKLSPSAAKNLSRLTPLNIDKLKKPGVQQKIRQLANGQYYLNQLKKRIQQKQEKLSNLLQNQKHQSPQPLNEIDELMQTGMKQKIKIQVPSRIMSKRGSFQLHSPKLKSPPPISIQEIQQKS